MKSILTKLLLKLVSKDTVLKLAKNTLVAYLEKLMTSKNVSVKSVGEKAATATKVCSHLATLCQNAADICADGKVDSEELAKSIKDISAFISKIKTSLE